MRPYNLTLQNCDINVDWYVNTVFSDLIPSFALYNIRTMRAYIQLYNIMFA